MQNVLIIEDTQETLEWLLITVQEVFPRATVTSATTLKDAVRAVDKFGQELDLAIVDLGLPDGSGIELIKHIRSCNYSYQVVVATIYDDDKSLFAALRAGANGYLLKDEDKDAIGSMLKGIEDAKTPISQASMEKVMHHFHRQGDAERTVNLTTREREVLVLISRGYSAAEAAKTLGIKENTAKGYIKDIYAKLGVSSRAEATAYAIQHGLIESQ